MKSENKRIFISDLPETFTQDELESSFSQYGQVTSVEIKERKELGPHNKSLFFAYINVTIDETSLNKCFKDFKECRYKNEYIQLQIARESFLERLKREREESERTPQAPKVEKLPETKTNGHSFVSQTLKRKKSISKSSSDDSENEELVLNKVKVTKNADPIEEPLDIIIKNNKGKIRCTGPLKIPSVGHKPIIEVSLKKKEVKVSTGHDIKRLQAVKDMKKSYEEKKALIKNALSYGTLKVNNKITFDDTEESHPTLNGHKKSGLFDEAENDSDLEVNFDVKEQFQGKTGQKLLELQTKYKNDKRFALDERFIDKENIEQSHAIELNNDSDDFEEEKQAQLKILGEVLGRKVAPINKTESKQKKTMLRFDPTLPEHADLLLDTSQTKPPKNKKEEPELIQATEPEVSKEVFYKVPEKLKDAFTEQSQFSLLSMFGAPAENEEKQEEATVINKQIKRNTLDIQKNPFKYDSSDDEEELEIPHKETAAKSKDALSSKQPTKENNIFWQEPFFFKDDDYRLQEGLDFVKRICSEKDDFSKVRREIKKIVKDKLKNVERKNKMFKKKLGGNKKRHIRMKKALKK